MPESLADLPAGLQWTEQTSALAKKIGGTIGYSPLKIDHIIDQTTGGMGKVLTGRQIPGKRFVTTPLAVSSQPTQEFYDLLGEMRKQKAGAKMSTGLNQPTLLASFEYAADRMGELRDLARKTTDPRQKLAIQNNALTIAKTMVENYHALTKE